MKRSALKLCLLILCIVTFLISIKMVALYRIKNVGMDNILYKTKNGNVNCYFIGTSRTKRGIDPQILKNKIPNIYFYNLGISHLSLNNSLAIVNRLNTPQSKNIFIVELSLMKLFRSIEHIYLIGPNAAYDGEKKYMNNTSIYSLEDMINIQQDFKQAIFSYFLIKSDLSLITNPRQLKQSFGYMPSKQVYTGSENSYLKPIDLIDNRPHLSKENKYIKLITEAIKEIEGNNGRVLFLLPLTFKNAEEKDVLLSIYQSIPIQNKLIYSKSLLESIPASQLLSDANHLNSKGAKLYTTYLIDEVKNQILVSK